MIYPDLLITQNFQNQNFHRKVEPKTKISIAAQQHIDSTWARLTPVADPGPKATGDHGMWKLLKVGIKP